VQCVTIQPIFRGKCRRLVALSSLFLTGQFLDSEEVTLTSETLLSLKECTAVNPNRYNSSTIGKFVINSSTV
jgi:hypothetical protein